MYGSYRRRMTSSTGFDPHLPGSCVGSAGVGTTLTVPSDSTRVTSRNSAVVTLTSGRRFVTSSRLVRRWPLASMRYLCDNTHRGLSDRAREE